MYRPSIAELSAQILAAFIHRNQVNKSELSKLNESIIDILASPAKPVIKPIIERAVPAPVQKRVADRTITVLPEFIHQLTPKDRIEIAEGIKSRCPHCGKVLKGVASHIARNHSN